MSHYKLGITLLSLLLLSSCFITSNLDTWKLVEADYLSENAEEFQEMCLIQKTIDEKYPVTNKLYPIYKGDNFHDFPNLITLKNIVKPASTKWVKKKADKNCLSADPEECLVWCLIEDPAKYQTLKIVLDTSLTSSYKMELIDPNFENNDDYEIWKQVICPSEITEDLIGNIQTTLKNKGLYLKEATYELDEQTQIAIYDFQEANGLSKGYLDFETLKALDLNY